MFEPEKKTLLEQIQKALEDRNLVKVAEVTKIHHNTLVKIRTGQRTRIHPSTEKLLCDYLNIRSEQV